MLIQTQFLPSGDLQIDAYASNVADFDGLESVLVAAGIKTISHKLPPDFASRDGRRYTVPSSLVDSFESLLEGTFQYNGKFVPATGTGKNFACWEITLSGKGFGCEDIRAQNRNLAITKCSMIAGNNNWYAGVPSPGTCP